MINPFSHIQDILKRSSKEAARTMGREISVEHLMLSLISQNDSDVNKLLKQFGEMKKMMKKMKKMQKGKKGLPNLGGLGLPKLPFMH